MGRPHQRGSEPPAWRPSEPASVAIADTHPYELSHAVWRHLEQRSGFAP